MSLTLPTLGLTLRRLLSRPRQAPRAVAYYSGAASSKSADPVKALFTEELEKLQKAQSKSTKAPVYNDTERKIDASLLDSLKPKKN
ncbi:hypothetical protein H696_04213 [Fonticula alba]|uniref:Uncharacterized protein n=1 Tax=Fonticula alba TaxID=691883 RepID=A0A058Z3B8_FONAL|nr:hypothetical protein H696_04213 [Fonticula alba]KCV68794.1 hypothetical protein H696_04213 [Fonticula alba]|eukprot:XP_009496365.1 hypothetical protein H696_04213 [Fonticula alba]